MSSSELIMQGHFTRVSWHNTAHFDVKKIIIFCYFTFHSFSPFYKQRETKNIPIQFQKGNKKIPEKYSSYWIFISFFLKKKKYSFFITQFPTIPIPSKKVRNIYFEFSILLLLLLVLPLSSRWFIGERKGGGGRRNLLIRNGHVSPGERGLMAILFLRECTGRMSRTHVKQAH